MGLKMRLLATAAALVSGLAAFPAMADPITTLFNTGVDGSFNVLADNLVDPHWTLISAPGGLTPVITGSQASIWLGADISSGWISAANNQNTGAFDYQTSFSLTGFDPATASIGGRIAVDNEISDILINGHSTGFTLGTVGSPAYESFEQWNPLATFSSFFVAGVNTIDFIVYNDGGPAGLRAELTGTASPLSVPEPASLALLSLSLGALALMRRRSA